MKRLLHIIIYLFFVSTITSQNLKPLKLNEIKASGWMKEQILRDIKTGYISVYENLQPTLQQKLFRGNQVKNYSIDKNGNWETRRETWWDGEHEGYFADVVVRNGFISEYKPWMDKARNLIDSVLYYQDDSGYIGIYDEDCRLDNLLNENGELWTQSRMINAILALYEFTGDNKYYVAAKKAVDYTISRFEDSKKSYFQQPKPNGGGLTHGLMYVDVLEWLYRLTGDSKYVSFAEKLYLDYSAAKPSLRNIDNQLENLKNKELMFQEHSVHVIEHFRMPFFLSAMLQKSDYDLARNNIFYKLKKSLAPSGTIVMDKKIHESVAGNYGSPTLPYEYCSITETVLSYCSALQKWNYAWLADEIENVTFNAGQASRMSNGKAISYASSDTKYSALEVDGFRYQVAACHKVACCNLQAPKLLPSYISNMWMKDSKEETLYAQLYGPCMLQTKIKGKDFRVSAETLYPFENNIRFSVTSDVDKDVTIMFRIPLWAKDYDIVADGAEIYKVNNYISVKKNWKFGEEIYLNFIPDIEIKRFLNNEFYIKRGALLYACDIEEKLYPTKSFNNGFCNYDVYPLDSTKVKELENITILENCDFRFKRNKSLFKYEKSINANIKYPFDSPYGFIIGKFRYKSKDITLNMVPIGSTLLRKVTFKEENR